MKSILITGDLGITDCYDKTSISGEIIELFEKSDFNIVNLEAAIALDSKKIRKTGPHLKAEKESLLDILKILRIDLVTLANNHIKDYGENEIRSTLQFCEDNNIGTVGAGLNLDEARKTFYWDSGEGIVAFLNFAENEWASASVTSAGAHPMDIIENVYAIKNAKDNANYVIAIVHGGYEYYNLPSPRMQNQYRFYAENGVNLVVGHHTHCISGCEVYKGVPIYYSLGNFLFTRNSENQEWYRGLILEIILNNEKIDIKLHPVCHEKGSYRLYFPCEQENMEILSKIDSYSEIILDDKMLNRTWNDYIESKAKEYLNYWSPLSYIRNKYIRRLIQKLGLTFVNKEGLSLLLNLMRCESHLDLSKEVIARYLGNQK